MRLRIAVTDNDWFHFLRNLPNVDEVNFWQPGGGRSFRALKPGEPLLFKLHSPHNYIVGGGFFFRFLALPWSFATSAENEPKLPSAPLPSRSLRVTDQGSAACIIPEIEATRIHQDRLITHG